MTYFCFDNFDKILLILWKKQFFIESTLSIYVYGDKYRITQYTTIKATNHLNYIIQYI